MTGFYSNNPLPVTARVIAPSGFYVSDEDRELFQRELSGFVPPHIFDVHVHLYDYRHIHQGLGLAGSTGEHTAGFELFRSRQRVWMGDLAPAEGLCFAFPFPPAVDTRAANDFVRDEVKSRAGSCGLLLIRPQDDPAEVESRVRTEAWSGFKVYHLFSGRLDSGNAEIGEFLPDWAWEIADRHELAIMLHIMRAKSLADEANQSYIRRYCRRYPGARLILAHAGRGFCAAHTIRGIDGVRGLDNLYFDTSAICESAAFEAVLQAYGPTRLMYGADFPISEAHGRCISLGDNFHWIYDFSEQDWPSGKPVLVGIESLLALRRACRAQSLSDAEIELIFAGNARRLLKFPAARNKDEQDLYREAKELIPGGTQLLSKRPEMFAPEVWPPYFREARGCEIITLNGRRVVDLTSNGIGSCLLGYGHPEVTAAVLRRVRLGAMSTLNPPKEVELAQRLLELHPWAEQTRFARAGGEALAIAVRLARAATGKDVIAFCGYHGWQDWYLAANLGDGGALTTHLLPGLEPAGVPRGLHGTALPFGYNDLEALREIVRTAGKSLAAVVMEPTRNTPPAPGFLEGVRSLCDETGARLVFDEVTSGFRLERGGVHLRYGVAPDVAVFAKALGNGHPVAAVVGRRSTMQAALHSFVSSTYWTESVGPTAALASLEVMSQVDVPAHVHSIGESFQQGLDELASKHHVPLRVGGYPALTTLGFEHPDAAALLTLLTSEMLAKGFLVGGTFYPTLAHTAEHVKDVLTAADEIFAGLGEAVARDIVRERLKTPIKHSGFARLN